MMILAIDPGPEFSAAVLYQSDESRLVEFKRAKNAELREWVRDVEPASGYGRYRTRLAIEMVASYGMPVGAEVFETCVWAGRFIEHWISTTDRPFVPVYRREVKLHLCGSVRATDATVRRAILDRFGPGRPKAVGTMKQPGPLYGLTADLWAAFAVALVVADGVNKSPARAS